MSTIQLPFSTLKHRFQNFYPFYNHSIMSSFDGYQPFSGGASVVNDGALAGGSGSSLQNSMLNSPAIVTFHPPCYDRAVEETDTILGPLSLCHTFSNIAAHHIYFRRFCDRHLGSGHYNIADERKVRSKPTYTVQGYKCRDPVSCAIAEYQSYQPSSNEERSCWINLHSQIMDEKELPQNQDKVYGYQEGLENPELEEARQKNIRRAEKNKADNLKKKGKSGR